MRKRIIALSVGTVLVAACSGSGQVSPPPIGPTPEATTVPATLSPGTGVAPKIHDASVPAFDIGGAIARARVMPCTPSWTKLPLPLDRGSICVPPGWTVTIYTVDRLPPRDERSQGYGYVVSLTKTANNGPPPGGWSLINLGFTIAGNEPTGVTRCAQPSVEPGTSGRVSICAYVAGDPDHMRRDLPAGRTAALVGASFGDPPDRFASFEVFYPPDGTLPDPQDVAEAIAILLDANFTPPGPDNS